MIAYSASFQATKLYSQDLLELTHRFYPRSNSSYVLTYVSGNVNQSQAMLQCGSLVLTVDIAYEIYQQVSTNMVQWAQFPSGKLLQPTTQKIIMNQAYWTIDSTYNYGTGFCPNDGSISSVTIFVTDSNSNQLSPGTYFTVNPA